MSRNTLRVFFSAESLFNDYVKHTQTHIYQNFKRRFASQFAPKNKERARAPTYIHLPFQSQCFEIASKAQIVL